MIVVLGIDPSLTATGYAMVCAETGRIQKCGTVQARNVTAPQRWRIYEIAEQLGFILFNSPFFIHGIAMEEVPLGGTRTTARALNRLNGAIGHELYKKGHRNPTAVEDVAVGTWRDGVGFKAPARAKSEPKDASKRKLKAALMAHAGALFPGWKFEDDNQAEAAMIALWKQRQRAR